MERIVERIETDQAGCDVEGNHELGTSAVSRIVLRCTVCDVSLGYVAWGSDRVPGQEDLQADGFEVPDGGGFVCRFVCSDCFDVGFRSLDYLRSTYRRVEPQPGRVSGDGDLRNDAAQLDLPLDLVETGSDSD